MTLVPGGRGVARSNAGWVGHHRRAVLSKRWTARAEHAGGGAAEVVWREAAGPREHGSGTDGRPLESDGAPAASGEAQ